MPPTPWCPAETLRPEAVALSNSLLRRRAPLAAAGLAVTLCPAPPTIDASEVLPLRLGGHPATLDAPCALLDAVLAALDPAAPAAEPELRRLLLELAAEDALTALDRVLPVDVLPGTEDPGFLSPHILALGLHCRHGGTAFTARLRLHPATASRVAALLDRLPPAPSSLDALRIPVHLRLGSCTLSVGELRSLRPGDVLIPACGTLGAPGVIVAVAGERLVWQADWDGRTARIGTPRQTAAGAGAEEWTMGDNTPAPAPDATLDELPVRVVFEVGRLELTVAELSAVAPGHVFTIPGGPPGRVDILANGRRIGQGELVQLGDGTGVRLLSLAGRPPGVGTGQA